MKKFLRKTFMIMTAFMLVLLIAGGAFAATSPNLARWYYSWNNDNNDLEYGDSIKIAYYNDDVWEYKSYILSFDMRLLANGTITKAVAVEDDEDNDPDDDSYKLNFDNQIPLKVMGGYPYSAAYPFPIVRVYNLNSNTTLDPTSYNVTWAVPSKSALDGTVSGNRVYFRGVFDNITSNSEIHTALLTGTVASSTAAIGDSNNPSEWTLNTTVYKEERQVVNPTSSIFSSIITTNATQLSIVSKDYKVTFLAEKAQGSNSAYNVILWPFQKKVSGKYVPYGSETEVGSDYYIYDGIAMPDWLKCTMYYYKVNDDDEVTTTLENINIATIRSVLSYDVNLLSEDESYLEEDNIIIAGFEPTNEEDEVKLHYLIGIPDSNSDEDTNRGINDNDENTQIFYPASFDITYNSSVPAPPIGTKGKVIIPVALTRSNNDSKPYWYILQFDVYYGSDTAPAPTTPGIVFKIPEVPDYEPGDTVEYDMTTDEVFELSVDVASGTVNNVSVASVKGNLWLASSLVKSGDKQSINLTGTPTGPGNYEFVMTATGVDVNNLAATASLDLVINVSPDASSDPRQNFTLSISPRSASVRVGASTTVTLTPANYSGDVTYTFSPSLSWITRSGNTLTIAPTTSVAAQTYQYVITATDGAGATASQTLPVTVIANTPTPDNAPAPTIPAQTLENFQNAVLQTGSGTVTVTASEAVSRWYIYINGEQSGTASVSSTKGSAANDWATINQSGTSQYEAVASINVPSDLANGSYVITVKYQPVDTSKALSDAITLVTITVSNPDYSPALAPTAATADLTSFQNAILMRGSASIDITAPEAASRWYIYINDTQSDMVYVSKLRRSAETDWATIIQNGTSQYSAIAYANVPANISAGSYTLTVRYQPADTSKTLSDALSLGTLTISNSNEILPVYGDPSDICSLGFNGLALALVSMLFFRKR